MLILYSVADSPRLNYIARYISNELFEHPVYFTNDREEFVSSSLYKINYSIEQLPGLQILPEMLLFETDIRPFEVQVSGEEAAARLFPNEGPIGFDLFAASFYLLSRYEEYLPTVKDSFGRYDHHDSIAYKYRFLNIPLINYWLINFKHHLAAIYPNIQFRNREYEQKVSFDVDIAFSYRQKGFFRTTGALLRTVAKMKRAELGERLSVLSGRSIDPYDSFSWLRSLSELKKLQQHFFFLVASRRSRFDRNNPRESSGFKKLVKETAAHAEISLHPSWRSGDHFEVLKEELKWLSTITGTRIHSSRQHYLRFILPETFRKLIDAGIDKDYSMGYGKVNGFRASVASPFYWYDLEAEKETSLLLYPFCFMDATAVFQLGYNQKKTLEELRNLQDKVHHCKGLMISIWHNSVLSLAPEHAQWRQLFENFLTRSVQLQNANQATGMES